MPRLELTDHDLILHLSKWEALAALHHPTLRVPLTQVRGATEDSGFGWLSMGWRMPGTHLPFVLAAGTFLKGGDRQFVYTRRKRNTIVIELAGHEFARLVIGVEDARAETARINAAVARAHNQA
ncbi:hypothetical protein [Massilia sp. YIM B02443]|jgi:hypothetical protein|uniref:hypothetical protein n=1 Tax=Massilia sp. YIM B02443 TaxID=3050127 RepID=UPI0025B66B76|nr:hypothetical protein [Massilia sp. YIM B02443]MDN4036999.1 hypothetical protein [Massilia sp. YIM B02443]